MTTLSPRDHHALSSVAASLQDQSAPFALSQGRMASLTGCANRSAWNRLRARLVALGALVVVAQGELDTTGKPEAKAARLQISSWALSAMKPACGQGPDKEPDKAADKESSSRRKKNEVKTAAATTGQGNEQGGQGSRLRVVIEAAPEDVEIVYRAPVSLPVNPLVSPSSGSRQSDASLTPHCRHTPAVVPPEPECLSPRTSATALRPKPISTSEPSRSTIYGPGSSPPCSSSAETVPVAALPARSSSANQAMTSPSVAGVSFPQTLTAVDLEAAVEESWRKRSTPSKLRRLGPVEDEDDWRRGARRGLLDRPEDIPGLLRSAETHRIKAIQPPPRVLTQAEKDLRAERALAEHLAFLGQPLGALARRPLAVEPKQRAGVGS